MADIDVDGMDCDVEIIQEIPPKAQNCPEKLAEAKKEEGNALYKQKKYREALPLYSEAIDLCPDCAAYYGNRAACKMMIGQYSSALEDIQQATRLDQKFLKGYLREFKCHIALGDVGAARRTLDKIQDLDPHNPSLSTEKKNLEILEHFMQDGEKAYDKKEYRKVVFCMDRAIQQAVCSNKLKLIKAECLAFLGRYEEAQEIANDILHVDAMNVDALYVRGMCLYYQDFVEKSYNHLQQVLRLAPDYSKVRDLYRRVKLLMGKKDEGNDAFKKGRLQEAYDLYSSALEIDPSNVFTNAKIYFNRATVCAKISKLKEAIEDCTEAIRLDENYIKAYLRRAKCYMDLEMFEECVRDYETVCMKESTRAHKQLLEQAKLELKKSKRKNYYKILDVEKNASEEEIRKAYRKRALLHHPDRHTSASEEERREQEKKFKEVGEAYNVLSDHKKRARYDSGQDLEDMEGFGGGDIDPNHIFQTFFGTTGGFSFSNFGGGTFSQVPSGFSFQFG